MSGILSEPTRIYSDAYYTEKYKKENVLMGPTEKVYVNADSGLPVLGGTTTIRVRPNGPTKFLSELWLKVGVSAVTKTGGTVASLCNAFPLFLFKEIQLVNNGTIITRITPSEIYTELLEDNEPDVTDLKKRNLGIDTVANRQAAAAAPQTFYVNLSDVFSELAAPFPIFLLNSTLDFNFVLRESAALLTNTDGTSATWSFSAFQLVAEYQVSSAGVYEILKNDIMRDNGYVLVSNDYLQIENAIPAGSGATQFTFPLSALIDKQVVMINNVLKRVSDISTSYAVDYTVHQPLQDYSMTISGAYVHGAQFVYDDDFMRKVLIDDYNFKGIDNLLVDNIYPIMWAQNPTERRGERVTRYNGAKNFDKIPDAQLVINFATSPANAMTLFSLIQCVKRVKINRSGSIVNVY